MNIRTEAKLWLKLNFPIEDGIEFRVSKYFSKQDIWFFTLPISYFDLGRTGHLNILLQFEKKHDHFHYLKVPFSFFHANKNKFDVRRSGDKFDLHISAKHRNWLFCERSQGINFQEFTVT